MRIGIDISQVVYEGTGVGKYIKELIPLVIAASPQHEFVLFGASWGKKTLLEAFFSTMKQTYPRIHTVLLPVPLSFLDFCWNTLHIMPITVFTGPLDIFWSSDWVQPPLGRAKGITTIHDVSFFHYPESFHKMIVSVQKRRLQRAVKVCSMFLCDSEATKKDILHFFSIPEHQCRVVYPGYHG